MWVGGVEKEAGVCEGQRVDVMRDWVGMCMWLRGWGCTME